MSLHYGYSGGGGTCGCCCSYSAESYSLNWQFTVGVDYLPRLDYDHTKPKGRKDNLNIRKPSGVSTNHLIDFVLQNVNAVRLPVLFVQHRQSLVRLAPAAPL